MTTKTPVRTDTDARIAEELRIKTAPSWRPTAGDVLTGTVVKLYPRKLAAIGGNPERTYVVMVMDDGDGYHAVHVIHSVLNAAVTELKPSPGDTLAIAYHGKVEPKKEGAKAYHNYTVVDPTVQAAEFSWDVLDDPGF